MALVPFLWTKGGHCPSIERMWCVDERIFECVDQSEKMEVLTVTMNFSTIASWTVIPESSQESQVLLTLTNPVENVTHVTLLECEEGDPDNINSTAKVWIVPSCCVNPSLFQGLPVPFVLPQATLPICRSTPANCAASPSLELKWLSPM